MEALGVGDPPYIGPYRLIGRLGAGGMGQVYLARSAGGRTVAVKVVQAGYAQQPEFRRRFAYEVEAARKVGGTWTAPVIDADTEAGTPWVATRYVVGPDLHTVVAGPHGPLPEDSVRVLANGLAHALRDIHAAGLIHRDLKPSNVLVTVDGPRVIDFGIARALDTVVEGIRTRTGAVIGSPGFMSPEQVRAQRLTPASDVFCLGSVLAYAVSGRTPFGQPDSELHVLMFRVAEEEPDLTGVPSGLRELVSDCLAKDPSRRPAVDEVLRRTRAGTSPWLPGELLADLGRRAAQLLDTEGGHEPSAAPAAPSTPASHPAPASPPAVAAPSSPTPVPAQPPKAPPLADQPAAALLPTATATVSPSSGTPAAPPRPKRRRGRTLSVALGGAAVVAALGVTLAMNLPGGGDTPTFDGVWETKTVSGTEDAYRRIELTGVDAAHGAHTATFTFREPGKHCWGTATVESRGDDKVVLTATTVNYDPAGMISDPMCAGSGTQYTLEKMDGGLRWTAYGYTADLERRAAQPTGSAG
ncbi:MULTISPECIES: serine/threonine-protein kinase [unclassified Streptomyces]|uniref:serine/threonine-protein kinase n=1 Tax=unclassified Streptomyces TaxID=2593676 RepID=UPI002E7FDD63|nr:serine/threonine-protein kinase [Streptomyces sp. NBC_00589]WTI37147.1 serine/threonine protein kinase [Streptomyces sp. NBC_00775]WUB29177.1 serine/threonine protein kinase [Streptomyces sp. NBC_00589]